MTAKEWVDKFTEDMNSGWLKADDYVGMEYWTYDDVRSFVEGHDYYDDITDGAAREVWHKVTIKLAKYDNVDFDVVQDTIAQVMDETIGVN
jgi:hypothetical protein